jgi:transcriptional regulator with XRE-family HTH domain
MLDEVPPGSVGALLRQWRERRRLSQLALALEAEISSRHLSFVETGRSHPSREMVLLLAEVLDVPPRARNDLLAAAGYAPMYRESNLDAPEMAQFRRALDFMLRQHEPYPAIVLDRYWNILLANEGAGRFLELLLGPAVAAAAEPPIVVRTTLASPNMVRLICHSQALRPSIVNWEATAAALIQWLHRDLLRSADAGIRLLLDKLLAYPDAPHNWRRLDLDAPAAPFLTIEMQKGETQLKFFTTLTTLGTPYDITLHELRIESFFPADEATDMALRRLKAASVG